jgi:hypothetical protein
VAKAPASPARPAGRARAAAVQGTLAFLIPLLGFRKLASAELGRRGFFIDKFLNLSHARLDRRLRVLPGKIPVR